VAQSGFELVRQLYESVQIVLFATKRCHQNIPQALHTNVIGLYCKTTKNNRINERKFIQWLCIEWVIDELCSEDHQAL
jgi:hypothetical protein